MLETEQILGSGDQELRIVAEFTDAGVATIAEQHSDSLGAVVVIDVEFEDATVADSRFWLAADCALIVLSLYHLVVLFARQFVGLFQVVLAKILPSFFGGISVSGQGVDVVAIVFGEIRAVLAVLLNVALATRAILRDAGYALIVTLFANKLGDVLLRESGCVALALIFSIRRALFGRRVRPLFAAGFATAFSAISVVQRAYEIFIVAVFAEVRGCFHTPTLSTFVAYNKVALTA